MSNRIDATYQNVGNISLDIFKADGDEDLRGTTNIRVGNKTFRVTIAADNRVSVSFANTSFFHLFQGNAKTAVRQKIQELVDNYRLSKDIGRAVALTSHRNNVIMTMQQKADEISQNGAGGRLAHYGFSSVRQIAAPVINQTATNRKNAQNAERPDMTQQLINDYNIAINLDDIDAATTIAFVRDNNADKWPCKFVADGISESDRDAWRQYLKGHDIDLFSKIRLARDEAANTTKSTGWAAEIRKQGLENAVLDMIRKNLDPRFIAQTPDLNFVLRGVAEAIIEVVDADFAGKSKAQINAILREIVGRHAPKGREEVAWNVFNGAATCAFWRQTSKLGLDFFKARGETVVFEWTKFDGRETDGAELADKWWKDSKQDVSDHFGVAITNSEMRHLQSEKYAQKPGAGQVVRIQGGVTPERIEQSVMERISRLQSLSQAELKDYNAQLKANLNTLRKEDFHEMGCDLLVNVPGIFLTDWFDGPGMWSKDAYRAMDEAFGRVLERVRTTKSLATQTAMLSSIGELFKAELMRDPVVAELLQAPPADSGQKVSVDVELERRLAGIGRGQGARVFFANDTGHPNALGRMVIAEAKKNGNDIDLIVSELQQGFIATFSNVATIDEALSHPAFRVFLTRAATSMEGLPHDYERLMNSFGVVRASYETRTSLDAHLAEKKNISPEAKAIFARRGDWDLNRLVFKAVEASEKNNSDVDAEALARKADILLDICQRAADYTAEVERMLGHPLTDAERDRVVDSYLDRDPSSVNDFRTSGKEDRAERFAAEYNEILRKNGELLESLRAPESGNLAQDTVTDMFIAGSAHKAKPMHAKVAVASLLATHGTEPVKIPDTGTNVEKIVAFRKALCEKIREAYATALRSVDADEMGYDDQSTIMSMFTAAYLRENPKVSEFLRRTVDAEVMDWIKTDVAQMRFGDRNEQGDEEQIETTILVHLSDMFVMHGAL